LEFAPPTLLCDYVVREKIVQRPVCARRTSEREPLAYSGTAKVVEGEYFPYLNYMFISDAGVLEKEIKPRKAVTSLSRLPFFGTKAADGEQKCLPYIS